jgi:hypothetical protein
VAAPYLVLAVLAAVVRAGIPAIMLLQILAAVVVRVLRPLAAATAAPGW